jgi:hypothetical protein
MGTRSFPERTGQQLNPSPSSLDAKSPSHNLAQRNAHSTSAGHPVVPCNAQFRYSCSQLDSAMGTEAGSTCPPEEFERFSNMLSAKARPRIQQGARFVYFDPWAHSSTGMPVKGTPSPFPSDEVANWAKADCFNGRVQSTRKWQVCQYGLSQQKGSPHRGVP